MADSAVEGFARQQLTLGRIIFVTATLISVMAGIESLVGKYLGGNQSAVIWAFTATMCFFALVMILNYCVYAQSIIQDELDRVALAKSELEDSVLLKRVSSASTMKNRRKRGK